MQKQISDDVNYRRRRHQLLRIISYLTPGDKYKRSQGKDSNKPQVRLYGHINGRNLCIVGELVIKRYKS